MKRSVLVVDDDPLILRILSTILDLEEFEVRTAESGEEALSALSGDLPDIVVSDVMMPGVDGFELCRRIKSDERMGSIPVVLLTAKDAAEDRDAGAQAGTDAYLTKPFSPLELIDAIESLLDERS